MPRPAVCPACREELDVPDSLRGKPVRCAACQATFTPPADDAPPASRPEPRDDPRDNPGYADRDDRVSRRQGDGRYGRRPAPARRSFLWLWLAAFGTFGVCCLGCVGFVVVAMGLADPDLKVTHKSADGRFQAAFPGPVVIGTKAAADGNALQTTTTVEHQRKFLGQPFDRYFVHSTDLKRTVTGARADALAKKAAAELSGRPGSTARRTDPARTDGADGYEVEVLHGGKEATVARVFVAGDRLYVVGITGQMLEPEQQQRAHEFWDSFKLADKDDPAPKPAKKPDAEGDE